jgi:hypothetical protein
MKDIIWNGTHPSNGLDVDLMLFEGIDLRKCIEMQQHWAYCFLNLVDTYEERFPGRSDREKLVDCNIEDSHWNWIKKAKCFNSDEYLWFSLEINNQIECAMIVFHPEKSRVSATDIFYVDYLAVSPWNRKSVIHSPEVKGLGSLMLKLVGKHINQKLNYIEGFSLHSLPKALPYYLRIGMRDFGQDIKKQNLHYLEMEQATAGTFYDKYL